MHGTLFWAHNKANCSYHVSLNCNCGDDWIMHMIMLHCGQPHSHNNANFDVQIRELTVLKWFPIIDVIWPRSMWKLNQQSSALDLDSTNNGLAVSMPIRLHAHVCISMLDFLLGAFFVVVAVVAVEDFACASLTIVCVLACMC